MGSPLSYLPHNAQPPARPGGLWGEKAPPQYPFREQRARASQGLYPTPPSSLPYTYPIPQATYPTPYHQLATHLTTHPIPQVTNLPTLHLPYTYQLAAGS